MKLHKILSILGPPGSGKGTQSKLLSDKFGYGFFSMGETLRMYAAKDTELGRKIKESIDQGYIVSDDLAEQVVTETWEGFLDKEVILLEGFPRTPGQVEMLNRFMTKHGITDYKVVYINVDKQKLIDRIVLRSKKEGRVDDADMKSIEKRFDEYNGKTEKIIEYYKPLGLVIEINGDQAEDMNESIQKVHAEIMSKI